MFLNCFSDSCRSIFRTKCQGEIALILFFEGLNSLFEGPNTPLVSRIHCRLLHLPLRLGRSPADRHPRCGHRIGVACPVRPPPLPALPVLLW